VSGTGHFTSRVQVEDVELSRKVLYFFAIDSIVNGGRTSLSACIWRWVGRICPHSAIFKNYYLVDSGDRGEVVGV